MDQIGSKTVFASSLERLEKNGGDDGTRTRGLCRDRAAHERNYLKSNGVGRHSLKEIAFLVNSIVPLMYPDLSPLKS
jgi:hypothetical protein